VAVVVVCLAVAVVEECLAAAAEEDRKTNKKIY
jgi:hypothetical protein